MSTLLIGLAMNLFFGGPECKVEYSLGMPDHWYVLDVGGIDEVPIVKINIDEAA